MKVWVRLPAAPCSYATALPLNVAAASISVSPALDALGIMNGKLVSSKAASTVWMPISSCVGVFSTLKSVVMEPSRPCTISGVVSAQFCLAAKDERPSKKSPVVKLPDESRCWQQDRLYHSARRG